MIRNFKSEDTVKLIEIIKKGYIIEDKEIISELQNDDKKLIVYDEDGIKGFACINVYDKERKKCSIQLYVDPDERRKGIGTALYKETSRYLDEIMPNILRTEFRIDGSDPTCFYKKLGYKKWFGCHEMYYRGSFQPEVDIEFIPYEDKYYEQYAKATKDCFYELRKENDIEPYAIPLSEKDREYTLKKKDSIYIALKNEQIIAAVMVENGYIDSLKVVPDYQGQGYGRKTAQFAINKALNQNSEMIHLTVVEWNTKAADLYKSLGFEIVQTIHIYRQFTDKE